MHLSALWGALVAAAAPLLRTLVEQPLLAAARLAEIAPGRREVGARLREIGVAPLHWFGAPPPPPPPPLLGASLLGRLVAAVVVAAAVPLCVALCVLGPHMAHSRTPCTFPSVHC